MAQIFDMKRLHQGCGESLQCNLLDLVAMYKSDMLESLREPRVGNQRRKPNRAKRKSMRFWG